MASYRQVHVVFVLEKGGGGRDHKLSKTSLLKQSPVGQGKRSFDFTYVYIVLSN